MRIGRRPILAMAAIAMASLLLALSAAAEPPAFWRVYIGTMTTEEGQGIYLLHLDHETGDLTYQGLAGEANRPGFLALHPAEPWLYSVGRAPDEDGGMMGVMNAFEIDAESGRLTLINMQPSIDGNPCHIAVDPQGGHVFVANGQGSVVGRYIEEDGALGEVTARMPHEGSSVHPTRQRNPHTHAVDFSPDGQFLFVSDLGIDKVKIYRYDSETGALEPNDPPYMETAPGAGPRHFTFHPSSAFAYVINELDNTITAFAYDAESGGLETLDTVSTLPGDFDEDNTTAEVVAHPSGRFLYGSNRGHDSIVVFSIDETSGQLTLIDHTSTQGEAPRNFNIDPTGTYLLAANQNTDNVVAFRIDEESGLLTPTGGEVETPLPVCVVFSEP